MERRPERRLDPSGRSAQAIRFAGDACLSRQFSREQPEE
jgi:hypothetical protein